jgi:hypothetical protein
VERSVEMETSEEGLGDVGVEGGVGGLGPG